jgi:hypothetical protein
VVGDVGEVEPVDLLPCAGIKDLADHRATVLTRCVRTTVTYG